MTPFSSCSNTSRFSCLPIEGPRHERAGAHRFYCDLSRLLTLRTVSIIKWLGFYVTKPGIVFYSAIVNGTVALSKFCVNQHHQRDRFLLSSCLPSAMCCYVCHLFLAQCEAHSSTHFLYIQQSLREDGRERGLSPCSPVVSRRRNFSRLTLVYFPLHLIGQN